MWKVAYEHAADAHQYAALQGSARMIAASDQLQNALLTSGSITAENMKAISNLLSQIGQKELAEKFASQAKLASPAAPKVNYDFRGSSFHLEQDFRGEDPDRVAVIFRKDVAKAAEHRLTARTTGPFGG
jgi:hypothetical protein